MPLYRRAPEAALKDQDYTSCWRLLPLFATGSPENVNWRRANCPFDFGLRFETSIQLRSSDRNREEAEATSDGGRIRRRRGDGAVNFRSGCALLSFRTKVIAILIGKAPIEKPIELR